MNTLPMPQSAVKESEIGFKFNSACVLTNSITVDVYKKVNLCAELENSS